jgi:hypothetical protein
LCLFFVENIVFTTELLLKGTKLGLEYLNFLFLI